MGVRQTMAFWQVRLCHWRAQLALLFAGLVVFFCWRRATAMSPAITTELGRFASYNVKMGPSWDFFSKQCFDHWDRVGHYSFEIAAEAWGRPPPEGSQEGGEYSEYVSSKMVLGFTDEQVRNFVKQQETARYFTGEGAYHNFKRRWTRLLHDGVTGQHILDFGSGFGIEALSFLKAENMVTLADINMDNLNAAERIINLHGHRVEHKLLVGDHYPFFEYNPQWEKVDIFYANSVLHHTPRIRYVMYRAHQVVRPGGQMVLVLYSDLMWDHCMRWFGPAVETAPKIPPIDEEPHANPRLCDFVVCADKVGHFADWYSKERIAVVAHGLFEVESYDYLTPLRTFAVVHLRRNNEHFEPHRIGSVLGDEDYET